MWWTGGTVGVTGSNSEGSSNVRGVPGWRGKLLSYGGKLTLLWTAFQFTLSVTKFSKWVVETINSHMGHFFRIIKTMVTAIDSPAKSWSWWLAETRGFAESDPFGGHEELSCGIFFFKK